MVASRSSVPMLTQSVAVVRKMLEAVAGSKPMRFNVSGREEAGEQVELQPGVALLEAAQPGPREPLLFLEADHRARLQGDLDRLGLEHALPAQEADQALLLVDHRIHRIVAIEHELHR